jgi:hypothetical protein
VIDERDEWSKSGFDISSPDILVKIKAALEQEPIILEHRFYRGSRAPDRLIFDDYADFSKYLESHARPGDSFHVWRYSALCRDDNILLSGKYPDALGRVPRTGTY